MKYRTLKDVFSAIPDIIMNLVYRTITGWIKGNLFKKYKMKFIENKLIWKHFSNFSSKNFAR